MLLQQHTLPRQKQTPVLNMNEAKEKFIITAMSKLARRGGRSSMTEYIVVQGRVAVARSFLKERAADDWSNWLKGWRWLLEAHLNTANIVVFPVELRICVHVGLLGLWDLLCLQRAAGEQLDTIRENIIKQTWHPLRTVCHLSLTEDYLMQRIELHNKAYKTVVQNMSIMCRSCRWRLLLRIQWSGSILQSSCVASWVAFTDEEHKAASSNRFCFGVSQIEDWWISR